MLTKIMSGTRISVRMMKAGGGALHIHWVRDALSGGALIFTS